MKSCERMNSFLFSLAFNSSQEGPPFGCVALTPRECQGTKEAPRLLQRWRSPGEEPSVAILGSIFGERFRCCT